MCHITLKGELFGLEKAALLLLEIELLTFESEFERG